MIWRRNNNAEEKLTENVRRGWKIRAQKEVEHGDPKTDVWWASRRGRGRKEGGTE